MPQGLFVNISGCMFGWHWLRPVSENRERTCVKRKVYQFPKACFWPRDSSPGPEKSHPPARPPPVRSPARPTVYYQVRLCTTRSDFVLPGPTLYCQVSDFVVPGPTSHSRVRLCTIRSDFVLHGPTLYYHTGICRSDFVLAGPTLY